MVDDLLIQQKTCSTKHVANMNSKDYFCIIPFILHDVLSLGKQKTYFNVKVSSVLIPNIYKWARL